ncbi:MAG: MraY family glycosyltransferase [Armatimonadota bacterium]
MELAVSLVTSIVIAALLTPVIIRLAPLIGAVDRPEKRRVHTTPTPTAGGLAIFVAFWVPVMITTWPPSRALIGVFIGSLILLVICLFDDIYGLPALPRLLGQILVAIVVYGWGVQIEGITDPSSLLGQYEYLQLGWLSAPLTVVWIVLIINAINWLDGLDGLAAGFCAIASGTLTIMAVATGSWVVAIPASALLGACLGFLPYNFNPARIFMGDTGAMFLGLMLASFAVIGTLKGPTALAVLAPLLILGVPLYDSISTVFKRWQNGKPIYSADKEHLHHRLLAHGLSTKQAVLVIYGLTAVLCLVALILWLNT